MSRNFDLDISTVDLDDKSAKATKTTSTLRQCLYYCRGVEVSDDLDKDITP